MKTVVVDTTPLHIRFQKLAILEKKSGDQILKDQMRLLERDLLKITPPTGDSALGESFNEQRKIGRSAIRGDINSVYRSVSGVVAYLQKVKPRAAEYLAKYARSGRIDAVRTMLKDFDIKVSDVVLSVNEGDYNNHRHGKTGRAMRPANPILVLRSNSVKQLLKTKLAKVGTAKGGWAQAAVGLGVSVPAWITGHAESVGLYEPDLGGEVKSITIGNLVGYAQKYAPLMEQAVKLRKRAMDLRIEHLLKHELKAQG